MWRAEIIIIIIAVSQMYLNGRIMKIEWWREWNFIAASMSSSRSVFTWSNSVLYYYRKDNGFYLHFAGQVTIEFHVEKETNFIVLHIQDLNITEKVILFRSLWCTDWYRCSGIHIPNIGVRKSEGKFDSWLPKWNYRNLIKRQLYRRQCNF